MAKTKKKPSRTKPGHCSFFLRNVPIKVKKKFKAKCAELDVSMQEALIAHMSDV